MQEINKTKEQYIFSKEKYCAKFLYYFLSSFILQDRHFEPLEAYCNWCRLPYDVIAYYEDWSSDIPYILSHAGFNQTQLRLMDIGKHVNLGLFSLTYKVHPFNIGFTDRQ